jgi:polar amino acid transport system permease protein
VIAFTTADIVVNLVFAARWTILLACVTFVGGSVLGGVILVGRVVKYRSINGLCRLYVEMLQGTPLLMQLFLIYFALGLLGVDLPPLMAACLGLVLWSSAFLAEIWRGCVNAIERGQWDASASLGMGLSQQLRYVIVPQATRIAVPPTVGFLVQVVKGTAVTSLIGFIELSRAGAMMSNATFRPFLVYGCVAMIYFILCWPLSRWSKSLEKTLHAPYRHN